MAAVVVSLTLAAGWLAAAVLIPLWYPNQPYSQPIAWVAYLMCVFNLVKAWAQHRARKRRAAAERSYREDEPPPVRRRP
jgi:hypothetical protein